MIGVDLLDGHVTNYLLQGRYTLLTLHPVVVTHLCLWFATESAFLSARCELKPMHVDILCSWVVNGGTTIRRVICPRGKLDLLLHWCVIDCMWPGHLFRWHSLGLPWQQVLQAC